MNKNLVIYTLIPLLLIAIAINNSETKYKFDSGALSVEGLDLNYNMVSDYDFYQKNELNECFQLLDLGKSFVGFKEAIAFKESRGDYQTVNSFGYMGKYQFGKGTLQLIGIYNTNEFLKSPALQEKAFIANAARNKWILRRDIKRFVGKKIDGVLITESGILAAAHLAGPGSVKKYLRSFGAIGFTDAYGTHIRSYIRKFSGYDTTVVKPNKHAKASLI